MRSRPGLWRLGGGPRARARSATASGGRPCDLHKVPETRGSGPLQELETAAAEVSFFVLDDAGL